MNLAMKPLISVLALTLLLAPPLRSFAGETLDSRLTPIIESHKGKVAVAVKHLGTGESFVYHENDPMPTASLIKFPVMIEAYRQAEEKKIDLAKMVTLQKSDQVGGSGILNQLTPGLALSVRDLIRLMIGLSDNTATNMVLDQVGIGSTAATMERMGYPNTKIHAKSFRRDTSVFPERSKQFGLGSTTASEMVRLFEALHKNELVSPEACASMTEHLLACDDKDKFPRFLPSGTKVAFKTGSVEASRTAAGIIFSKSGPIALCVLSDGNEDHRWVPDNAGNRLCAEIAREVFDYFNPPSKGSASGAKGN